MRRLLHYQPDSKILRIETLTGIKPAENDSAFVGAYGNALYSWESKNNVQIERIFCLIFWVSWSKLFGIYHPLCEPLFTSCCILSVGNSYAFHMADPRLSCHLKQECNSGVEHTTDSSEGVRSWEGGTPVSVMWLDWVGQYDNAKCWSVL